MDTYLDEQGLIRFLVSSINYPWSSYPAYTYIMCRVQAPRRTPSIKIKVLDFELGDPFVCSDKFLIKSRDVNITACGDYATLERNGFLELEVFGNWMEVVFESFAAGDENRGFLIQISASDNAPLHVECRDPLTWVWGQNHTSISPTPMGLSTTDSLTSTTDSLTSTTDSLTSTTDSLTSTTDSPTMAPIHPTTRYPTTTKSTTSTLTKSTTTTTTTSDNGSGPRTTSEGSGSHEVDNTTTSSHQYSTTTITTSQPTVLPAAASFFTTEVVIGIAGGGVGLLLIILIIVICCCMRKRKSAAKPPPEPGRLPPSRRTLNQTPPLQIGDSTYENYFTNPGFEENVYDTIPYDEMTHAKDMKDTNTFETLKDGDAGQTNPYEMPNIQKPMPGQTIKYSHLETFQTPQARSNGYETPQTRLNRYRYANPDLRAPETYSTPITRPLAVVNPHFVQPPRVPKPDYLEFNKKSNPP